MTNPAPKPKNEMDDATRYRSTAVCFLLAGAGMVGVAIYYYQLLARMEREHGLELLWSLYAKIYDEYGKGGVAAFNLAVALLFYVVSGYCFVKWRRLRKPTGK